MMDFSKKVRPALRRSIKRFIRFFVILIIGFIITLGAWCLPPQMLERIIQSLKPKAAVEELQKTTDNEDDETG